MQMLPAGAMLEDEVGMDLDGLAEMRGLSEHEFVGMVCFMAPPCGVELLQERLVAYVLCACQPVPAAARGVECVAAEHNDSTHKQWLPCLRMHEAANTTASTPSVPVGSLSRLLPLPQPPACMRACTHARACVAYLPSSRGLVAWRVIQVHVDTAARRRNGRPRIRKTSGLLLRVP